MASLRLCVTTPGKILLDESGLDRVQVPLSDGGEIGILPRHASLLAATVEGPLRFFREADERRFMAPAGILRVQRNVVTIFAAQPVDNSQSPAVDRDIPRLVRTMVADMDGA